MNTLPREITDYDQHSTICTTKGRIIKKKEKRSIARNFKIPFLVCSLSNSHKISVSQSGFTQFKKKKCLLEVRK